MTKHHIKVLLMVYNITEAEVLHWNNTCFQRLCSFFTNTMYQKTQRDTINKYALKKIKQAESCRAPSHSRDMYKLQSHCGSCSVIKIHVKRGAEQSRRLVLDIKPEGN